MERERLENVLRTELTKDDVKQIRTYYLRFYNEPEKYLNTEMVGLVLMDLDKEPDPNWVPKPTKADTANVKPIKFVSDLSPSIPEFPKSVNPRIDGLPNDIGLTDAGMDAMQLLEKLILVQLTQFNIYEYDDAIHMSTYISIKRDIADADKRHLFRFAVTVKESIHWLSYQMHGAKIVVPGIKKVLRDVLKNYLLGKNKVYSYKEFDELVHTSEDRDVKELHDEDFTDYRRWLFDDRQCISELSKSACDLEGNQLHAVEEVERMYNAICLNNDKERKEYSSGDKTFDDFVKAMSFSIFEMSKRIRDNAAPKKVRLFTQYAAKFIIDDTPIKKEKAGSRLSILLEKAEG